MAQPVRSLPAMQETRVRSLCWEDPVEKEMATQPSILAWKIPWTEEPGKLQFKASQRVKHDMTTKQQQITLIRYGAGDGGFRSIAGVRLGFPSVQRVSSLSTAWQLPFLEQMS